MGTSLGGPTPFIRPLTGLIAVFRMMIGDFDDGWFQAPSAIASSGGQTILNILFILYMGFVMVIMLNVLIAVVSESYDCARVKAPVWFMQTRLEFVAELDVLGATGAGLECLRPVLRPWASILAFRLEGGVIIEDQWMGHSREMEKTMAALLDASEKRIEIETARRFAIVETQAQESTKRLDTIEEKLDLAINLLSKLSSKLTL